MSSPSFPPRLSSVNLLRYLCFCCVLVEFCCLADKTTVATVDHDSYEFNLRLYQQQQQQKQLGAIDNFITSENFGNSEFDSVKEFRGERGEDGGGNQFKLNSPAVVALNLAKQTPKDDHQFSESSPPPTHHSSSPSCSHLLPSTPANLTSPNYPAPYPAHLNCIYRIPKLDSTTCKLQLNFIDFELDSARDRNSEDKNDSGSDKIETEFGIPEGCTQDYLEFNDQKRFCRNAWNGRREVVQLVDPEDGEFNFRFITNSAQPSKGFHISYTPISGTCSSFSASPSKPTTKDRLQNASSDLVPMLASPTSTSGQTSCEHRHHELEFSIKSDGYPNRNYSNNLDCVHYVIRKSEDICGLELRFLTFELESSEGCAYDFVEIDGESFCGQIPNGSRNIFKFSEDIKSISFQTDSKGSAKGFSIEGKQISDCDNAFIPVENKMTSSGVRTQKCNFISSTQSAQLTSLKYPAPYPDDILCAYTIEKPNSGAATNFCSVELRFTEFDLQQSVDCSDDFLEIQNSRFCGRSLNGTSRIVPFSEDGFVKFLFRSDSTGSTASKGFALNYTLIECVDGNIPGTSESKEVGVVLKEKGGAKGGAKGKTKEKGVELKGGGAVPRNRSFYYREPCFKVFADKKFEITTELVNGSYRENLDCLYTIRKSSPKVCYLEVHFRHFDLEASPDCQYDYVEIGNAVRLCGTLQKETSRIYGFEKAEVYINFHTDASTERSGLRLEVEQLECEGDRIVREEEPKDGGNALDSTESSHQNTLQQQESISSEFDLYPVTKSHHAHHHAHRHRDGSSTPKFEKADFYCSKIYEEKEFFIHSPGYPDKYTADLDCLYMVRPYRPTVCKIEVNLDQFELQPFDYAKNCLKSDFLDVDSKEQFCGKMPEAQSKIFPFLNQTFFIHFHSDSFRTSFDKGFRLFIRQIDCDSGFGYPLQIQSNSGGKSSSLPSPSFSRCNKIYTGSAFDIKSHLYPTTYLGNSFCQYRIIKLHSDSIKICYLEITFKDFDLQESPNCSKDYVSLNGIKLCGSIVRDSVRQFPFYDSEFIITFSSDRSGGGRGFHLQVRQNECAHSQQQVAEEEDGERRREGKRPQGLPEGFNTIQTSTSTSGFFSNFQILQANQLCQQVHSSAVFELESPHYPAYYLPGLSCGYTIRKRHPNVCQLELVFAELDIEPSSGCRLDYLLIDGVKYCNLNRPSDSGLMLPFYELEKRFLFRTTEFRSRKGFLAQVRQIDCSLPKPFSNALAPPTSGIFPPSKFIFLPSLPSICEICVTSVTGNLQSYDYPAFYPANVNCTYRVTPLPANCMVQIRFEEFDFDYSPECDRDYLEINGVRYCGSQLKGVSMLLLNKRKEDLSIRMISHSRGAIVKPSFRGFRATYTQLPCLETQPEIDPSSVPRTSTQPPPSPSKTSFTSPSPTQQLPTPTATSTRYTPTPPTKTPNLSPADIVQEQIFCDQSFTSERFEIKSPGYPYRYFDGLNCAYQIVKSSERICRLKVLFNYFNVVGEDGACRGDYLDVGREKICGVLERFTIKEIPFAHSHLLFNFHTNPTRTANGFHLSLEQVDCYPGGSQHPPPPPPDPYESVHSKTHHHSSQDPAAKPRPPSHFILQQKQQSQEQLKYDDDETEFDQSRKTVSKATPMTVGSTTMGMMTTPSMFSSSASMTMATVPTTRRPAKVDVEPHVVYEPKPVEVKGPSRGSPHVEQTPESYHDPRAPNGRLDQSEQSTYPLRYFSRNITVLHGGGGGGPTGSTGSPSTNHRVPERFEQQRWEVKGDQASPDPSPGSTRSTSLCSQMIVEKMYFELTNADLLSSPSDRTSTCQLHVKKAKSNICQLDIHFVRYWANNDTTCGSQYLSIDGERICGHVPANTIKKFWFVRPDLYLFAKLPRDVATGSSGQEQFVIKARQVECATNLEQQSSSEMQMKLPDGGGSKGQDSGSRSGPGSYEQNPKPKSPKYNFYEQHQQLQDKSEYDEMIPKPSGPRFQPQIPRFEPQNPMEPRQIDAYPSSGYRRSDQHPSYPNQPNQPPTHQPDTTFNHYCDLIASESAYKIVSPRTPGPHRCRYTIRRSSSSVCAVEIKFNMFRLEEETSGSLERCKNEYLEIDGGKICGAFPVGHERRYYFLSDQQEKFIYFTSNRSSQIPGDFVLDIKQLEDCSKPMKTQKPTMATPTICDSSIHALRGSLKSPNYPAPYDDYTRCTYRIQAASPDYCTLKLVIRDLDIESDMGSRVGDCGKDYFELQQDVKLCGREVTKTEHTIPFESLNGQRMIQMRFVSDSNGNGRGFNMDYVQELCPSAMHPLPTKSRHPSPIMASKTQFIPMHTQSMDSNSLTRNPIRPSYPPNYVSKAHLLKSMDRKQFIKLMLMEEEREKMRMNISSSSSTTKAPEMTVKPKVPQPNLQPQPPTTTTPNPIEAPPTTTTTMNPKLFITSTTPITNPPSVTTLNPENFATEVVTYQAMGVTISSNTEFNTMESTTQQAVEMV